MKRRVLCAVAVAAWCVVLWGVIAMRSAQPQDLAAPAPVFVIKAEPRTR